MLSILIIDIVFILSPSLPEVRVRVTSETETARYGPGRQEKDWPGPERGRPGGNFTIITLLLAAAAWRWLAAGGPGQAAAGQVARQGRAPVVPELGPGCVGSSRFPWHWLDTGTATGHSDSSSGTGLVSLRSACQAPPCLARKIANKKSSLLPVSSWHQLTGILVRHPHLVKVKRDQTR